MADRRPIGVFDSGVGGLTVVAAMRRAMPAEQILYLGDTARVPYGSKSPRTVERYAGGCHRFLVERGVKAVVIACNTASATALPSLQASSSVPVVGAVQPGAQSAVAATRTGRVGVIGTLATIRSGAYREAIRTLSPSATVSELACPLLVPLAEEGWTSGTIARAVATKYLAQLFELDADIDTLVLGCTHYPLLSAVLGEVARELAGRQIAVVDSATAMAKAVADLLVGAMVESTERGELHCFVTDASRLDEQAPLFLGEPIDGYELVDL